MIDNSSALRDKLEAKLAAAKGKRETQQLQEIPFTLDEEIAERVEKYGREASALKDQIEALNEAIEEREDEGDVRASGEDLSEDGKKLAELTAEFARVVADLEDATSEALNAQVTLVFRRASADEYEQMLKRAGGAAVDTDAEAALAFHNSLVERCFLHVLDGDEKIEITWAEFEKSAGLTFGDKDPIRALVYANNRRSRVNIPFSSAPSRPTRS